MHRPDGQTAAGSGIWAARKVVDGGGEISLSHIRKSVFRAFNQDRGEGDRKAREHQEQREDGDPEGLSFHIHCVRTKTRSSHPPPSKTLALSNHCQLVSG